MTRNERQLKAVEQEMERYSNEAQAIWKKADEEDRETSNEERGEVEKHLKAIEDLKAQKASLEDSIAVEQDVKRLSGELGRATPAVTEPQPNYAQPTQAAKSLGEIFVQSEQFKSIQGNRGSDFSTGPIEISMKAGTLLSGTLSPGSGQGGGFLTVPQVQPGVVDILFQRLTVADILPSGQMDGNTIRYIVEGTATSGAAGVLEGGAKPASDLAVSTRDEQAKKIATILTVSDEMLDDAAAVSSYINARLSLFVKIEEERQLLRGSTAAEVPGLIGRSGVNTYPRGTVDNNAVALFKAINGTRGSSFLEPDYIVMHPDNWQTTRLLTDGNQQFYGGGPFTGAYGNGPTQAAVTSNQVSGPMDSLWNKPVIVTTAIGSGTALLGAFGAAAQLFRKSGITVEASNSHASYFTSDLVAIRAEERLALCVWRPSAFTTVTGLS